MSRKKDNRILGVQKDRLILGLTMDDAVAAINLAMRVRKLEFTLDFTDPDHLARLYVSMPGVPREGIMVANPRNRVCYRSNPAHPDLRAALSDMHTRLSKLEAGILLAAYKEPNKKPEARLQLRVGGARSVALTLMDCVKGQRKTDTSFQLPDGTTP